MRKKIAVAVALILLFSTLVFNRTEEASAESLYIRKIVSVVYDDSGSMISGGCLNWAYANYALQAFCGLLNNDDQLYITYMSAVANNSNHVPPQVSLDASSIQSSVDGIRNHDDHDNTPYDAIDVAFKKLRDTVDSNVNTQYWLVILSDGEFQTYQGLVSQSELTDKLENYSQIKMPNGSAPNISYLAIGNGATRPVENKSAGINVYTSTGSADIVKTLSEIADKISGRTRVAKESVVQKDSNTIELTTTMPLLNIAVLAQKTTAEIVGVSGDSMTLSIAKHANLRYPEHDGWATDTTLAGSTYLISYVEGGNISAGTYRIEFNQPVKSDDLVNMFEPAIEIRMEILVNGKEIDVTQLSDTVEGDKIDVSYKLYETGTSNEILASVLPEETEYQIAVLENGQSSGDHENNSTDMQLQGVELKHCETEIKATVSIKGFNPIVLTSGPFTPQEGIKYTVQAIVPDNYSMTIAELKTNKQKIYFEVYADGEKITDIDKIKQMGFVVNTEMPGDIAYESDGRVSFKPTYRDPLLEIPTGNADVVGSLGSKASATASFYVKPPDFTIAVVGTDEPSVVRTELEGNTSGVQFEVFMDGEKLDKQTIEAIGIEFSLNKKYSKRIELSTTVNADGSVTAIPKSDTGAWLASYTIPLGKLEITAKMANTTGVGKIKITNDAKWELIWKWLVPIAAILFVLGEVFKKRFNYSYRIHYNHAAGTGMMLSGPRNGWNTSGLFSLVSLIPFVPDSKSVNGARFHAKGHFWDPAVICVKASQLPPFSGTMDSGADELESIRFNKNDIGEFDEGEKRKDMIPGGVLVTSTDRNYRNCQVYLYSDK